MHVFWWGETWHHRLGLSPEKIFKETSSFRWREEEQFGRLDPQQFAQQYLADAATVGTTSRKMQALLAPWREVSYCPNGIDPNLFYPQRATSGTMKVGWAGNINDACKGIHDIIMPACGKDFELIIASGNITSRDRMRDFYNQVDVFCVASTAEGQPLPPMESLACGGFQVAVNVGIIPEIIRHRENGLVVNRSVAAFRAALTWCYSNIDSIRAGAAHRAHDIHQNRNWATCTPYWRAAYDKALGRGNNAAGYAA